MEKKREKLTNDQWIDFCKGLAECDIMLVEGKNILGRIIEWGTGNKNNLDPSHALMYLGDGSGKIIEATDKGVVYDVIEKYKKDVMNAKSRIVTFSIIDLSVDEAKKIKDVAKNLVGYKYGWASYIGWSIYGIVNKFTPFGGLLRKGWIKNPFSNEKSPICSQVVFELINSVDRIRDRLKKQGYCFENFIPESLERFTRTNPDLIQQKNDTMKYFYE